MLNHQDLNLQISRRQFKLFQQQTIAQVPSITQQALAFKVTLKLT